MADYLSEDYLKEHGMDEWNAQRIGKTSGTSLGATGLLDVMAVPSGSRFTEHIQSGEAKEIVYKGKRYAIDYAFMSQDENEFPLVRGYGYDEENNGYDFTWMILPEFWDMENYTYVRTPDQTDEESLLSAIALSEPLRVEFDRNYDL